MFYLNNDNMEEMFREAAENYQLNTDAALDWEKVGGTLLEDMKKETALPQQKEKKKRRFVLWYLLLIPLGWFANYAWNGQFADKTVQNNTAIQTSTEKNEQGEKITASPENAAQQKDYEQPVTSAAKTYPGNKSNYALNMPMKSIAINKKYSAATLTAFNDKGFKKLINDNKIINKVSNAYTNCFDAEQFNNQQFVIVNKSLPGTIEPENKAVQSINESSSEKKTILQKKPQSGFYAGLLFAPDITFIKFQKTPGIGSSFGLIAGYKINNKWSIETGVLSDKKKYYTKGAYFDKSNVSYLNNKELVSVDGDCEMIEIPINARYTFSTTHKGKWTTALGTSSYFMKEEYYTYLINVNGTNEEYNYTYYPSSKNYLAVINLTVAYEKKIGKSFSFRAEPYLKIPLTGLGTGSLPLSGAGINIGIMKSFH